MIFLITGGMGAGKTLNALKQVRDLQLSTGRPVCYTSRIELEGPALEFGWKEIDIKNWQDEPDGTIFLVDECHKDFPVRGGVAAPPSHVQNLAEHRHRGFDFFLVTQHPKNIDSFIRRLIGNPGWHKHLKRRAGAPLVTVLKWDSVYERCEANGSGDSAEVTHVPYPKEVFGWYKSATIHTSKFKIPKAFWMFAGGLLLVAILLTVAYFKMRGTATTAEPAKPTTGSTFLENLAKNNAPAATDRTMEKHGPMTAAEFFESAQPRITGLPHTAPRYDELTKPRQVPYPAACMQMGKKCQCFTQQATPLNVPPDMCAQIVKSGVFLDFLPPESERRREEAMLQRQRHNQPDGVPVADRRSVAGMSASAPQMQPTIAEPVQLDYTERKAAENARVTSILKPNYPGR